MENRPFSFFLLLSFGLHILLIVFFLSSKNLRMLFAGDKEVVIPPSIRVDMVGLPDLPVQPKKLVKKRKPIATVSEKSKKPAKSKTKPIKKQKSDKKEKTVQKKEKGKSAKEIQNVSSNSKPDVNKGNQLTEGADKGKDLLSEQQISEINIYFSGVEDQIKSHWNLPKYLIDMDLTAQIEIQINNRGKMTSRQIVGSSGNELFDSQVLKAMESASPYPPPPASVQKIIRGGIVFTLNSRDQ